MTYERLYGAEAPDGLEWQLGKTAGSIQFVHKAEKAMRELSTGPARLSALQRVVDAVKAGEMTVNTEDLDPQDFLVF